MKSWLRNSIVASATASSLVLLYFIASTTGTKVADVTVAKVPSISTLQSKEKTKSADQPLTSYSPRLDNTNAFAFIDLLAVGKQAPVFSAKSSSGKTIKLADYQNKKNVVLIFYQGSFCSLCEAQLSGIQKELSAFEAKETEVIAISADDMNHAKKRQGESGLSFPVLPDAEKKIIQRYGVANISKNNMAWPSVYIINKSGRVSFRYASKSGKRLQAEEILAKIN
ncbi:MAG: peroxiredoxin family protein [Cyanobacteria bacterium P01_H01_bin.74]